MSLERHQRATDFDPGGVCGSPIFALPFTSARVQSRFEFVELDGGKSSNFQGEVLARTGIMPGWYQAGMMLARTTHYICTSIYGMYRYHVHLYHTYHVCIYESIPTVTYHVPVIIYTKKIYTKYLFVVLHFLHLLFTLLIRRFVSVIVCNIFCFICFPLEEIC